MRGDISLGFGGTVTPVLTPSALFGQTNIVPDNQELAVLKKLYDSLGGANWTNKTNWPTPGNWPATATITQMATWRGISVSNGDISNITLSSNNLVGKIPSNIGDLAGLTNLMLKGNTISGKIPPSICNLVNLKVLQLQSNRLTGSIPTGVSTMASLEDVQLQGNLLLGSIPPGFGSLTHLVSLDLSSNDLGGKIPHELSGATALQSLQLQGNELTNSIPPELGDLSQLRTLMLYNNHLVGSIPPELGNLSSLQTLRLSANQLSGKIPSTLGNINTLVNLYLDENQFSGSLPPALGELTNLVYLSVESNQLTGKVPGRFGKLTSLRTLYLQNNDFEGGIHDSLQYMSQLQIFYAAGNSLSGSIPSWIGSKWPYLTHLAVDNNLMNGPLPASLGALTKIRYFNVSNNDFEGRIPDGCEGWNELVTWSCSNNRFSGTLHPDLFANKPALGGINVSFNQFRGAFPSILGSVSLTSLNARNNLFTTLPAGLFEPGANVLATLNFGYNELTTLPDLSAHGNKANLTFTIYNNRLDFTALELTRNAGIKTVTLLPQRNFKDITSVTPEEGQPLVIPARPLGTGTIAWEKLQTDGVTWGNVDGQNQDNSKLTFRRNAFTKATDEGTYRFSITGTGQVFQGIVLRSEPMRVNEPLTIVLDDWAFQYRYDGRRRMTHKKVPGAGWVYMVYDERDRLVLTQDAEQRTKKLWSFTKYDALNRPVMTGLYTHDSDVTQEGMSGLVSTTNFYETYTGNAACHGYSNNVFPTGGVPASYLEILTVTYYDNYDFKSGWGTEFDYAPNQIEDQHVNDQTYAQGNYFHSVIGQVTGTKVRSLEAEPYWMQAVMYYDDRYRPLQVIADNYKKGTDRVTNIYDFVGKVLATKTDHLVGGVTWTNDVNVTIADDKLSKSSSGNAWSTSGASSVQQIPAGVYGWVEATVTELNTTRIFGLSTQDVDQNHTTVGYGFLQAGASLSVRISGTVYAVTGLLAIGDKLRIARETSGAINFYRNGIKINPATMPAQVNNSALVADVAFYTSGSSIGSARLSAGQGQQQIVERWMDYDHGGRLKETWHRLNGGTRILLAKNEYNELGQLVDKKLHSTVSTATDAKQSVDYRYNIRGWLTSINNAALTADATNDDTNDLFGMNLGYNTGIGIAATEQFNGNISAIKYSKDWGKGDVKQTGYAFKYDPMNRLNDAFHKQRNSQGNWESGGFDEAGITYDLNGNIQALQRRGKEGVLIDDLKYTYSTPDISASNKLLYVEELSTDGVNKAKGFADGNQGENQDYTYDANGNMTRDLNKGIGTNLTDATNVIAYNHLNLPQMVSKGGSTIRYVYDATGRKLAQQVMSGASQKRTDYAGEFVYEDHALQFVNHEEGRIVVAVTKPVYTYGFDVADTDVLTAINAGLSIYESKGEKYVVATSDNASPGNGVFPIGDFVNVDINQRYRVRVKSYTDGTTPAYLQVRIKSGANILSTNTALIAQGSVNECWIEQVVTTPASGSALALEAGVVWNSSATGQRIYLNEIEIIRLETTAPEYQYHLKDHLGNVRVTFTTKDEVETVKATMEEAVAEEEGIQFQRYEDMRLSELSLFDHTNDNNPTSTAGRAILLRGGDKETAGLLKTLSVMPGDVVHMKVYAKYIDPNPEPDNWSQALTNLVAALANGQAGTVTDGQGYATNGTTPFPFTGLNGTGSNTAEGPQAYLNYLMFDRDFKPLVDDPSQSWFVRLSDGPKENKATILANPENGVPHELMEATVTVKQAGYLYIYLSNEEDSPVEVFFDDFEVMHTKGPVVQSEEYYPFGLSFNSYSKENSVAQDYKYNGKEEQKELGLGWLDYGMRMYQPELGRFFTQDRFAEKYRPISPYQYAANNPIRFVDVNGDSIDIYDNKGGLVMTLNDGKEKSTGIYFQNTKHKKDGSTELSNGVSFGYNDEETDRAAAKDGKMQFEVVSDSFIEGAMDRSGVNDFGNKAIGWEYLYRESSGSNRGGRSGGKMDYWASNNLEDNKMYIVQSKFGDAVGYNSSDLGNFLWGLGTRRLGFSVWTAQGGAHGNNAVNGQDQNAWNPKYEHQILDSNADQQAIRNGYYYNRKPQENGVYTHDILKK